MVGSYIDEFTQKTIPKDYFYNLISDIKKLNKEFHAFNLINEPKENGFPFSVKDNICVENIETTASSMILKGYIPPFDATVVRRLKENNFQFIGKTNMDEFGFGSFGIHSETPARNPFDSNYVAGGSSSGSAIATSIIKYHISIAESTGGSISTPASFCGVVGFTPTYGLISRYGLIDYSNSLDKIGIMARSTSDIWKVFDMIRGFDGMDSTSIDKEPIDDKVKNIVIIKEMTDGIDEIVLKEFERLIDHLKNDGFNIKYIGLSDINFSGPVYYIISMAEASTNLAKFNGFKYGYKVDDFSLNYNDFFTEAREVFGEEVKRRIILGTFIRSASVKSKYYEKALRLRSLLIKKMKLILKDAFILSPTMPIMTPKIEDVEKLTPTQNYMLDKLTIPPNLCGFPHISFPFAYINGLPLGVQLIADHFQDYSLLSFVKNWENKFDYKFKCNLGEL